MRCITAIWPAGPPKLSIATRAQTRDASPKLTPWAGRRAALGADERISAIACRSLGGGPVVRFVGGIAAPAVECVVEAEACLELGEVIEIHARQAERGRQQAG